MTGKRRLFVHIGLPKTGSTTIQVLAHGMRGALAEAGIGIPRTGRSARRCCHNALVYGLSRRSPGRRGRDPWQALAAEIAASPSPALLLSAELFTDGGVFTAARGRDGAARLKALAAELDIDVRLLACVRPQWQYAESLYSQLVKRGFEAARFEDWMEGALRDGVLDYAGVLGPWREAFGERLSVRAMDLSGSGASPAAHFLGWLGVPAGEAARWGDAHENPRPGAKELEALRRACAALIGKGYGLRLRKRLMGRLAGRLAPVLDGDAPFEPLGAADAGALWARFAPANRDLAAVYAVEAGGVLLREPALRAPGPGRARWSEFGASERRRVRRLVMAQTGADVEGARDPAGSSAGRLSGAAAMGALRVAGTRAGLFRVGRRPGAARRGQPAR